jgi:hypothetical protein
MNYNKSFFGLFLAALVLLPGCILRVPSYDKQQLKLIRDNCGYNAVENGVSLQAKLLTESDKRDLFGKHIGRLEGNDYKIVYISMHNLSDKNYYFGFDCIDLKQLPSKKVVKSMKKTSSIGRFIFGYVTGSIHPLYFVGCSPSLIIPVAIALSPIYVVASLIGFVQGIKSVIMNTHVRKDIEEKIVSEEIIITSGDHYEGLVFVKSADYSPHFTVTLHEKGHKKNILTFDVDVQKSV